MYDTSIESPLEIIMKKSNSFFKTIEYPEHGWIWNGSDNKMLGGTRVEFDDKEYDMTPATQYVIAASQYNRLKSISDGEKTVFRDMLHRINYYHQLTKKEDYRALIHISKMISIMRL